MKKLFLLIVLFTGIAGFSQPGNKTDSNRLKKGEKVKKLGLTDSMIDKLLRIKDSVAIAIQKKDSILQQENISRSMSGILQLQKDRKTEQKRAAIVRIAIGAAFLILLIIGWRRKKK